MKRFFEDNNSLYEYDMRARKIISSFADRYFYPHLLRNHEALIRNSTKEDKEKGKDLVIRNWWERKNINICEKVSSHYINSQLSNFAFEIGTGRKVGWFVREDNETDYYSIIWVHADKNRYPLTRFANNYFVSFQEIDIDFMVSCFLKKENVFAYLAKHGFSRQDLLDKANEMAQSGTERDMSYKNKYGFWFVYSKGLYEAPVNIILTKELLCKLSTQNGVLRCYRFSKDGIALIQSLY